MPVLFALLAACSDQNLVDSECRAELIGPDSLSVSLSENVVTVATLDLLVTGTADVTVTLEADGAPRVDTDTWPNLQGAASLQLYGLRADTTYVAHVRATAGAECDEDMIQVTTGSLPAAIPSTTLVTGGDGFGTWTLLGWIDDEDYANTGALVLDEGGAVVWYWISPLGMAANATWVDDSGDILVRSDDRSAPDDSMVYRVSMDGETRWMRRYPKAHHELGQAPDIDFAFLRAVPRMVDDETVVGDEIVEVAADGTEHVVWNAFDCMPDVERHSAWETATARIPGRDWTHANSLSWCADENAWLVSLQHLREVRKVRRSDCSDVWVLDGDSPAGNAISIPGAADRFGPQHAPVCTGSGVVLFDNDLATGVSRGLALDLDLDDRGAGTASARWSVPHPEGGQAATLGSTQLLPDESVLLGWGSLGEVSVVNAAGGLDWHVALDHATIGNTERRASLYGP